MIMMIYMTTTMMKLKQCFVIKYQHYLLIDHVFEVFSDVGCSVLLDIIKLLTTDLDTW